VGQVELDAEVVPGVTDVSLAVIGENPLDPDAAADPVLRRAARVRS
jgi:hypothetical protein